ncbi:unnamed protein product [Closterium sp. NIES-53]
MLRAYGCMVVFHVPKEKRGKLEASGRWGVHLGLAKDHKGWLIWDLTSQQLTASRDVKQVQVTVSEEEISGVSEDGGEPEVEEQQQQQQQDAPPRAARPADRPRRDVRPPKRLTYPSFGKPKVVRAGSVAEQCDEEEIAHCYWAAIPEPKTLAEALSGPDAEKWKHKYGPDGELTRYKSRLVAKGFQQTKGKEFDEIFAPVEKGTTLRELYMLQPEGLDDGSGRVCRLKKAIYGLKQAPRAWYHKLEETLLAEGFKKSECDHSLFLLQEKEQFLMLLVYVDDILLFSKSSAMIERVEEMLEMQFKCSKMGDVKYYLGMHVERDLDNHEQVEAAKRLVRYVSATTSVGLEYSAVRQRLQRGAADLGKGEMLLTCYTDASFNSVKADGTSIRGYVCLFGGGAVSWCSKKQNEVGQSFCETEYMALHHGAKEVVWLRHLLEEIGVCQKEPTVIFCDNESAVKLAKNACLHGLTKHIRPKWHWVRRLLDKEDVTFDKSICFYHLHPHTSSPLSPPPLFLVPGPPPVDPLPLQGPTPSAEGGDPATDDTVTTRHSPRLETPPGFPPRPSSPPPQHVAMGFGGSGGTGGAGARGAGAGGTGRVGAGGARPADSTVLSLPSSTGLTPPLLCPPTDQSQPHLLPCSPLPTPAPHTEELRPSSVPQHIALPSSPASSLPDVPHPKSDLAHAANPTVTRLLATVVTDPDFESTVAFALVTELVDFAARSRLDYVATLVTESESVCPPSVRGELALGCDVLEDRQFELECLATALPCFTSMLLCPKGDPDALDIPTPRSYGEAITGEYSSQWQTTMDAEMASWKSTGTYGVDFFQTFSPTPKMTILQVLLHVATQRDYELRSLDFSTDFLQGSLHEEIWLRHPPGFTGSFLEGTQWSLRRPVYGLRQAPREWHDTLRTTLAAIGFAPSTADPSLYLRTDPTLPPFYTLVYVDDLVFVTADTEALTLVKAELQKRHTCTDLGPPALPLSVLLTTAHSSAYRPLALSSTFGRVRSVKKQE